MISQGCHTWMPDKLNFLLSPRTYFCLFMLSLPVLSFITQSPSNASVKITFPKSSFTTLHPSYFFCELLLIWHMLLYIVLLFFLSPQYTGLAARPAGPSARWERRARVQKAGKEMRLQVLEVLKYKVFSFLLWSLSRLVRVFYICYFMF